MTAAADPTRRALLGAVRAILRPLVRQLIARGVTYPAFSRLAKEVYIEVGTRHFTLSFKRQTDCRVALVTGITRKEIGQIRRGQAARPADAMELAHGVAARVVGRWRAAPPYAAPDGAALTLSYDRAGDAASFVDLVGEIGGDIPPRAVLDELLRAGAATLTPRDAVRLTAPASLPARDVEAKLARLGTDAAELIEAITHDIEQPSDAFLQRKVFSDHIGAAALPEVRSQVRRLGDDFARAVQQVLGSYERTAAAPGGAGARAVVAVYYFDAPAQTSDGRRE